MIIGQTLLLNDFAKCVKEKTLNSFVLIRGPVGSGRRTLAKELISMLNVDYVTTIEPKMESVQEMITISRASAGSKAFLVEDITEMSNTTANALLKILEEPPKNTYYIVTAEANKKILTTLLSRAQIFNMLPYTTLDIMRYARAREETLDSETLKIITDVCEVPGEVDTILKYNITEFYNFANKVVDTIATAQGANAFKIADKLNLKDDETKYDVVLFLKAFTNICMNRCDEDMSRYLNAVSITANSIFDIRYSGANKAMIIDMWILDIRKAWIV